LTGQEIKDIREISVGAEVREDGRLSENGGFLHVSGMKFYYDSKKASGNRVMAMYIDQGGRLTGIDLNEDYLVATNAFTAKGGDGLTPFAKAYADGRVQDTGTIDWEQLRDYMVEEQYLDGVVDPVIEGRINDIQDDPLLRSIFERINSLEEAIRQLEAKNGNLTDEIAALRELLAELRAALEVSTEDLAALEERIAELDARIAELEKEKDPSETEDPEETENGENGENSGGSGDTGASGGSENGGSSEENTDREENPVGVLPQTGVNVILPL